MAQGMVGLVKAARSWQPIARFAPYAETGIKFEIIHFVRDWQEFVELDNANPEDEREFFEWSVWPYVAPFECWTSLDATPEELVIAFEEFEAKKEALTAAMISLDKRERQMIHARFMRSPAMPFQAIAREHQISYARTVFLIKRSLGVLREVVENFEFHRQAATPSARRG